MHLITPNAPMSLGARATPLGGNHANFDSPAPSSFGVDLIHWNA
jgi:hypothetical protein